MNILEDWSRKLRLYLHAAYVTRSINWRGLPLIPKGFSPGLPSNRASYNEFLVWIRHSVRLRDARVIFDVGANHGVFAQAASTCFPEATVFLFEPLPTLRPFLEALSVHYGNRWRFRPLAFGAANTCLPFHVNAEDDGIGSFVGFSESYNHLYEQSHGGEPAGRGSTAIEVSVERLDDFCEREGIKHIDLVKIDVEGFEFAVLDGARKMLSNTTALIIETSLVRTGEGKPATLSNMVSRLTEFGFYIVALYPAFVRDAKGQSRPGEYNILARRFDS
ncbi:MAG TPA: FkbM family methyltransferase [Chthoniobacterales bacterium]|jgi:FkbM family methyltransferase|nr:FkbM family methyltransferase [Chthoniobacterales bacterium]